MAARAVRPLVDLLELNMPAVQGQAASAVQTLATGSQPNSDWIRSTDAARLLTGLLSFSHVNVLSHVNVPVAAVGALGRLVDGHGSDHEYIAVAVPSLVALLMSDQEVAQVEAACILMSLAIYCNEHYDEFIEGAVHALRLSGYSRYQNQQQAMAELELFLCVACRTYHKRLLQNV